MLFLFLAIFPVFVHADDSSPDDQRADCQVALVEEVSGAVKLLAGDEAPVVLSADDAVQPGDTVVTERGSWADLRLCDGSGIRVGESSRFQYVSADNEREHFASWAFELLRGAIRAAVIGDGQGGQVKLRVRTPTAALGVRGTELVVDAADEGEQETQLHTIEGEVLIGPRADFDKLAGLRGGELRDGFEPVGKEKMSVIRRNEARPLRAAAFRIWEFRRGRGPLLDRALHKLGWGEVRPRLRKARQRMRERRGEKPLFDRPREKLEERVAEKKEELAKLREKRREEKKREEIQEKRESQRNRSTDARQKGLRKELEENSAQTKDKRAHKGWRKWYQKNPQSPRHPNLGQ